jgi:Predicted membrane protein
MEIDLARARSFLSRWPAPGRWAQWLRAHADLAAFATVVVVSSVQLIEAGNRVLNDDEALNFDLVNVGRVAESYRRARSYPNPPLFYVLLHFWIDIGRFEFFLRLLPAAFWAAFLWLSYRWAGRVFGKAIGFLTLAITAFSPTSLFLSTELRAYTLLLMLSAAALVEIESAAETSSLARMTGFFACLSLAALTHYAAVFVVAALAVYAGVRLRAARTARRVVLAWACFQVGLVLLYLLLYFTEMKSLRGSDMERHGMEALRSGYFHRGEESALFFIGRQTRAMFSFFYGSAAGVAALCLAVAGVLILAARRQQAVLLPVLPYLFGALAGVLGLYPFSETRHSVYFLLFIPAAIGVALASLAAWRRWAICLASVILVPLYWPTIPWPAASRSVAAMERAMDQLRRTIPSGSLLFTDHRSKVLLSYYLDRDKRSTERFGPLRFWEEDVGPYCVVATPLWTPDAKRFGEEAERFLRVYRPPAGQPFWAVRLGAEFQPISALGHFPGSVFPVPQAGSVYIAEVWPREESETVIPPPGGLRSFPASWRETRQQPEPAR